MTICVKFHMRVKKLEKDRPTKMLQADYLYMVTFQRIFISLILNFFTGTVHLVADLLGFYLCSICSPSRGYGTQTRPVGLPPWDLQEQKYSNISPQEAHPLRSVPPGAAELSEGNHLVARSESWVLRISSKCLEDALRASMFFYLSLWFSCQAYYITGEALQKIHMKSELLCRK